MTGGPGLQASVVIATRNRKSNLRSALMSVQRLAEPVETLVLDDGSNDGSAEMVRAEFPSVRLIAHPESRGYIARRNEGARLASADIIFSIDDDAAFSSAQIVQQTLAEFEADHIGAVAMPYVDVMRDDVVRQRTPDPAAVHLTDTFIGTAHAVRRDLFLSLGGYREHLIHQGEESDFCIRMLDAGYVVRMGSADPIHHFESPKRDFRRMDFYGPRNAVLFAWQNVPLPFMLVHLAATTVRAVLWSLNPDRLKTRLSGIIDGYRQCMRQPRKPVAWSTYRRARRLRKQGATG